MRNVQVGGGCVKGFGQVFVEDAVLVVVGVMELVVGVVVMVVGVLVVVVSVLMLVCV